jgi:hypothetical protein
MSGEKSLALRLPYATINYESIGSLENGNSPVIHFAVKNTVSMDEAMKSLEVEIIKLFLAFTITLSIMNFLVYQ